MTKKKQVGVRFDSNRTRLKTGETQRPNGTYAYRWSTPDGKRHSIYAPTLEKLREQEEQIIVDKHDGIRSDVKSITVNEMFNLWCQLKTHEVYPFRYQCKRRLLLKSGSFFPKGELGYLFPAWSYRFPPSFSFGFRIPINPIGDNDAILRIASLIVRLNRLFPKTHRAFSF